MEERTAGIDSPESIPLHITFHDLFDFAATHNYSAAIWRLPSEGLTRMIVDLSGQTEKIRVDMEEGGQGFVFSPFMNLDNTGSFFIKNDLELTEGREIVFSKKLSYEGLKVILDTISKIPAQRPVRRPPYYTNPEKPSEISEKNFQDMVKTAIEDFDEDKFQKVVLSRCRRIALPDDFHPLNTFNDLCARYPNAFVSMTALPSVGAWIGASPEILISSDHNKVFRTAAIAGTQLYDPSVDLLDMAWTQKEIEEQAMVSRYIVNCFKRIRLREYEEIGPRTARAGNLAHLKSDFIVDTQAAGFPQLGTVMLGLLHPTSAVCGVPRQTALDFIRRFENYDRGFYSGYLGPMNVNGETHLYVNLRCMQLFEGEAALYAGAGITRGSKPEKEWKETEIKMNTLLEALQ